MPSRRMPSVGRGPTDRRQAQILTCPLQDLAACNAGFDSARDMTQADLHIACSLVSLGNHPSKQSTRTEGQPSTSGLITTLLTLRSTPPYPKPSREARVCRHQPAGVSGVT